MADHVLNALWDLLILDADLPEGGSGGGAVGDVDGDGKPEILIGPRLLYDPDTFERHVISDVGGHVGTALEDVDGDGRQDVLCGRWWYRNPGWERREIPGIYQVHTAYDIDGDGALEVIATKEDPEGENWYGKLSSELCWLKPVDPLGGEWEEHPVGNGDGAWLHATAVADLDGDGEPEIVVGEHDKLYPYRSRSRLLVYKKADAAGTAWYRYRLDDRFEHHDGAQIIELEPGRLGIIGHGWAESLYVHLWEPC